MYWLRAGVSRGWCKLVFLKAKGTSFLPDTFERKVSFLNLIEHLWRTNAIHNYLIEYISSNYARHVLTPHMHVKINDKIEKSFGIVMTPLLVQNDKKKLSKIVCWQSALINLNLKMERWFLHLQRRKIQIKFILKYLNIYKVLSHYKGNVQHNLLTSVDHWSDKGIPQTC